MIAGVNRPRWWSCCSGWGWCWWRALCYVLSMYDMYMNMYEMLYDSWDSMYVFDMVVYVGMCPNSCMIDDVLGALWLVWFVCYCCIVVYCYRCRQTNKSSAEGISPKVLEHDEEHNRYMKCIWLQVCVCVNRATWIGGAYGSYTLKGPREDRVFGFDALALDDALWFNFLFDACAGYEEPGNHCPMFIYLAMHHDLWNW